MSPACLLRSSARAAAAASSSSSAASTSSRIILPSKRSMGRAKALPVAPYAPLPPLSKEHPPAPTDKNWVHPLAKWDSFLDIPEDPNGIDGITLANDPPIMPHRPPPGGSASDDKALAKEMLAAQVGLTVSEINGLYRFTLSPKRVSNMTKGGRVAQHFVMTVVGSPERGLLGWGQGKSPEKSKALEQSFVQAVKNMDTVCRYQNRTVWGGGPEMSVKYGAVDIRMRARPPGFGLKCAPILHKIFTACGIKDISAKFYGSHNHMQSIKAMAHILHGGSNPKGMGDGIGGPGRSSDKGRGMRDVRELEIERGRYGVEVGNRQTRF